MSPAGAWAVFWGTTMGLGLWSLVAVLPRMRRPRLAERIAPYLLDISTEARLLAQPNRTHPLPVLGTLFSPLFGTLARGLSSLLGGTATIERRLTQSGSARSVDEFRSGQLIGVLTGIAGGAAMVVVIPAVRELSPLLQAILPVLTGAAGGIIVDHHLRHAATARLARIRGELPTVLEFLTLSLTAGEGILDALRRVAARSSGELAGELRAVLAEVATGVPLATALTDLADRVQLTALTRFVDQVTGALDRGTPLAEVLRAQSQDAREEAKRDLLELAGKKEIAMMLPLVFLILPTTILFAVFPGLFVLQAGF